MPDRADPARADLVRVRRAILSVSDKADLVPFARALASRGVEIVSTGGTARALLEAGLAVVPIERVTGLPEMMGGRVKTLHPAVHGGLLHRRDEPEDSAALERHGFPAIDLVCVNLYPFVKTVRRGGSPAEVIENIDVGGPAMIRSAAKNHAWVCAVTSPAWYDRVVSELDAHEGATSARLRAELAAAAFAHTAEYDAAIAAYLSRVGLEAFPSVLNLGFIRVDELRYGENPHQSAAVYRDPGSITQSVINAAQLHGKALSYNNFLDAASALELVKTLRTSAANPGLTAACVVKHLNPCGAAIAPDAASAVDQAMAGDPVAAFGGILAVAGGVDASAARRVAAPGVFLEVIVADSFTPDAIEILKAKSSAVRLLAAGPYAPPRVRALEYRSVPGGMLVQDRDIEPPDPSRWTHASGPAPTPELLAVGAFAEAVAKSLWSNAIAIVGPSPEMRGAIRLFGAGAGQMDRVTACRLAAAKAGPLARGAVAASDGFFPFPDGPGVLIDAGVRVIIHPGGSKRDQETFDACAARGVTCLTTGLRRFRH